MVVVPGAMAAGFTAPALAHFGDLLGRDARGASIKSRSLATLQKVQDAHVCARQAGQCPVVSRAAARAAPM